MKNLLDRLEEASAPSSGKSKLKEGKVELDILQKCLDNDQNPKTVGYLAEFVSKNRSKLKINVFLEQDNMYSYEIFVPLIHNLEVMIKLKVNKDSGKGSIEDRALMDAETGEILADLTDQVIRSFVKK